MYFLWVSENYRFPCQQIQVISNLHVLVIWNVQIKVPLIYIGQATNTEYVKLIKDSTVQYVSYFR